MSLTFDGNGVATNTFGEIFQQLDEGYRTIYGQDIDTDQESQDGQRIGIEASLRFDVESGFSWLYSSLDPDLNNGDMQQIVSKLAGVYLLPASRSQWDLDVESSLTTTLPENYTITDKNNQKWFLDSDVDISTGTNTVTFLSYLWGAVTGAALNSEFTQATPELGVTAITATDDAVKGRTEETEEAFRVRRKRSVENPAQSTVGSIYAKLAQLSGVIDLQVYDNSTSESDVITASSNPSAISSGEPISITPHTMWAVMEGGSLDDIGEVIAKQRLGNTKGDTVVSYTDTLTKPDGTDVFIVNEHKIDRPDYVDLHINISVTQKVSGSVVDTEAIKDKLATYTAMIGVPIQAAELTPSAFIANYNYVVGDIEISKDGITYTEQELYPGYGGKFTIDTVNINVAVVAI